MAIDVVLDTNVLLHASNNQESRQEDSIKLLMYLLESSELICVDPKFTTSETTNASIIGYEYLTYLKYGMLGYSFVAKMASSKRICEISHSTEISVSRAINQCLSNKHDKIFLKVAINSTEKILVSHDFKDFTLEKRKFIRRNFEAEIIAAKDYIYEEQLPIEGEKDE